MVFGFKKTWIVCVLLVLTACGSERMIDSNSVAVDTLDTESTDKTFVLEAQHLRYFMDGVENPELRVKQGDTVRIEFMNL